MKKSRFLIVLFVMVACGVVFSKSVFAKTISNWSDETVKKAYLTSLYTCYEQKSFKNNTLDIDKIESESDLKKMMKDNGLTVPLPTGSVNDKNIRTSCQTLLFGEGGGKNFEGLLEISGKSSDDLSSQIKGLGYSEVTSDKKACYRARYNVTFNERDGYYETNKICFELDESGIVKKVSVEGGRLSNVLSSGSGFADIMLFRVKRDAVELAFGWLTNELYTTNAKINNTKDEFLNNLKSGLTSKPEYISANAGAQGNHWEFVGLVEDDVTSYEIKDDDYEKAGEKALVYFSDDKIKKYDDLAIGPSDLLTYYLDLLTEYYYEDRDVSDYWVCDVDDWSMNGRFNYSINLSPNGKKSNNCKIDTTNNVDGSKEVYRFEGLSSLVGDKYVFDVTGQDLNLESLIDEINRLVGNLSNEEVEKAVEASNGASIKPTVSGDDDEKCYDNSGKMGWIICPIVTAAADLGNTLYQQIEENHLKIPAGAMFENSQGLETAWGMIRDIANIIFIILFMLVIFSQLTGVGIDNYGIKKIMPRLIIVAILVNLSFLICQLAVDLSNIVGSGINTMFSDLAEKITIPSVDGVNFGQGLAGGALAAGAGALFVFFSNPVGWGSAALIGVGVALAVLGLVIIILVALLFLYLILIIREAGIVLLIAVAPIAIVCYLLPNTEKITKKWFNLLKALLLVYPICGLLVGGGVLASRILGSIDTKSMKVAGMLIEVVPFFLIPTVLKSSLSLMGNVGSRLSNFGRSIGRRGSAGLKRGVANSEKFKDWSKFQQRKGQERRAKRRIGWYDKIGGKDGKNLTERQKNKKAAAIAAWASIGAEKNKEEMAASDEFGKKYAEEGQKVDLSNELIKKNRDLFERKTVSDVEKETRDAIMNGNGFGNAEKIVAGLEHLSEKGGREEVYGMLFDENIWNKIAGDEKALDLVQQRFLLGGQSDIMNAFAKYRGSGGNATFRQWATGKGDIINSEKQNGKIKNRTFAAYLNEIGENALNRYHKDDIGFVKMLSEMKMPEESLFANDYHSGTFGRAVVNELLNSNDNKALNKTRDLMENGMKIGSFKINDMNITSDKLARFNVRDFNSLVNGQIEYEMKADSSINRQEAEVRAKRMIYAQLGRQYSSAMADERLKNRMDEGIIGYFKDFQAQPAGAVVSGAGVGVTAAAVAGTVTAAAAQPTQVDVDVQSGGEQDQTIRVRGGQNRLRRRIIREQGSTPTNVEVVEESAPVGESVRDIVNDPTFNPRRDDSQAEVVQVRHEGQTRRVETAQPGITRVVDSGASSAGDSSFNGPASSSYSATTVSSSTPVQNSMADQNMMAQAMAEQVGERVAQRISTQVAPQIANEISYRTENRMREGFDNLSNRMRGNSGGVTKTEGGVLTGSRGDVDRAIEQERDRRIDGGNVNNDRSSGPRRN